MGLWISNRSGWLLKLLTELISLLSTEGLFFLFIGFKLLFQCVSGIAWNEQNKPKIFPVRFFFLTDPTILSKYSCSGCVSCISQDKDDKNQVAHPVNAKFTEKMKKPTVLM